MTNPVQVASVAVDLFYVALGVLAIIAGYYVYHWLKASLVPWAKDAFEGLTSPNDPEAAINTMFTPHQDDGSVAPKDIAPKGVDPVDWIFMQHDLSEPV